MLGLVPTDTFHKEMFIFLIFVKPFFSPRENCRQMSSRNPAIPMQSFILRFSNVTAFCELRADKWSFRKFERKSIFSEQQ